MGIALQILFAVALGVTIYFFSQAAGKIKRNILLGKPLDRNDNSSERYKKVLLIAFGQSKLLVRPLSGLLHFLVYAGFLLINMEMLEIVLDGLLGTHRLFGPILGSFYNILIATFEVFMLLVTVACVAFLVRRYSGSVARLQSPELTGQPSKDASIILWTEIILMTALMIMNATDQTLQTRNIEHYVTAGIFPISGLIAPLFTGLSDSILIGIERTCWWVHILGIFAFLNYLPYSKHFHIMLAFLTVFFSNLKPKGEIDNMKEITEMLDPDAVIDPNAAPAVLGAKDVMDLNWKNLLDAYTCTECGRCTSVCPANITGKLLSPRKIMMSTRDRLDEVGKNIDSNKGTFVPDNKSLLGDFITPEEIWACTTCNACTEACPINLEPVSIIIALRRHAYMELSSAPETLNRMSTNVENNGSPWSMPASDRFNWAMNEIEIPVK